MTEELKPELAPIEEKMTQELVKANVTEAVIASIREKYLPLKIAGLDDKETYLLVKEGRKECKSLRVMAKKICTNGREEATAIQKAWIAKEKEVTGRISEVEDYLEAQEKEYEAGIAAEKEERKRKQEEQLILRQQELTGIGVLYSDGKFSLGDVSFELSAIKESDNDIWNETIWPLYKQAYEAIEADRIEQDRLRKEREAELKREQEALEKKKKELADKEAELKREEERQALEADKRRAVMIENRTSQIASLGFKYNGSVEYHFHEFAICIADVHEYTNEEWDGLITRASVYVTEKAKEEAEEKRKEQERKDLQNKRYSQLLPYKSYGMTTDMDELWSLSDEQYIDLLAHKSHEFNKSEEQKAKEIAEKAAKAERERIEEEQRQAKLKREQEAGKARFEMLQAIDVRTENQMHLGTISDDDWKLMYGSYKAVWDREQQDKWVKEQEIIRKQEEERKAEELAQASDKVKWEALMVLIKSAEDGVNNYPMRSGQYRKKAAIFREKLEEIKAL